MCKYLLNKRFKKLDIKFKLRYNEDGRRVNNMYEYMNGVVTDIKPNGIVLDVNNIGYFINTPNPYAYNIKEKYQVYLYQVVKEDELSLFGFKTIEEKDLFLKLINVKGLGPRMAQPILATGSISGIVDAINRENIMYLKKFPKIGDKLAKQIVLDLKGKLGDIDVVNNSVVNNNDELREVLLSLGYKEKEIKNIMPQVDSENTIEQQVKDALKLLLK